MCIIFAETYHSNNFLLDNFLFSHFGIPMLLGSNLGEALLMYCITRLLYLLIAYASICLVFRLF